MLTAECLAPFTEVISCIKLRSTATFSLLRCSCLIGGDQLYSGEFVSLMREVVVVPPPPPPLLLFVVNVKTAATVWVEISQNDKVSMLKKYTLKKTGRWFG